MHENILALLFGIYLHSIPTKIDKIYSIYASQFNQLYKGNLSYFQKFHKLRIFVEEKTLTDNKNISLVQNFFASSPLSSWWVIVQWIR